MHNDLYHADLSRVSASMLKALAECPRVFQAKYIAGVVDEPSAAMQFGTALHCRILEPERFSIEYVVKPDGIDFRTKDGKQWRDDNKHKFILDDKQARTIEYCRQIAMQDEIARKLIDADGEVEHVLHWTDELSGVDCKAKADKLFRAGVIVDIKTTQKCTETAFKYACRDYYYGIQAAHYMDGLDRKSVV